MNNAEWLDTYYKNGNTGDITSIDGGFVCETPPDYKRIVEVKPRGYSKEHFYRELAKWLNQPHEILDAKEKSYLREVIKPFRNRVKFIEKVSYPTDNAYWIDIDLDDDDMRLPSFTASSKMYLGMVPDRHYTLSELGL